MSLSHSACRRTYFLARMKMQEFCSVLSVHPLTYAWEVFLKCLKCLKCCIYCPILTSIWVYLYVNMLVQIYKKREQIHQMCVCVCIREKKREGNVSPTPLASPDMYQCIMLKTDQSMTISCTTLVLCISNQSIHTLCYWIHHSKIQRLKPD